jgi:hypothetical protein
MSNPNKLLTSTDVPVKKPLSPVAFESPAPARLQVTTSPLVPNVALLPHLPGASAKSPWLEVEAPQLDSSFDESNMSPAWIYPSIPSVI